MDRIFHRCKILNTQHCLNRIESNAEVEMKQGYERLEEQEQQRQEKQHAKRCAVSRCRRAVAAALAALACMAGLLVLASAFGAFDEDGSIRPMIVSCFGPVGIGKDEIAPATRIEDPMCKSGTDGCNRCSRSRIGGPLVCTEMACETTGENICDERFDLIVENGPKSTKENLNAPPNCKSWFSGCNKCHRNAPGGRLACTKMMCRGPAKDARCIEFFTDEEPPSQEAEQPLPIDKPIHVRKAKVEHAENMDAPSDCQDWFTGCNRCHRSEPGASLACTRMACAGTAMEARCVTYFPTP